MGSNKKSVVVMCKEIESDLSKEELNKISKADGIVSCKIVPYAELDDETLEDIYNYSGAAWIAEHRPDWIKRFHPEHIN